MARAANRPASAQAAALTRRTGMPRRSARSAFSAEARSAMPSRVRRRKAASPTVTTMTVTKAATSLPVSKGWPRLVCHTRCCHGVVTVVPWLVAFWPSHTGMKNPRTARLWATAMVITVAMRRGTASNRRMTRSQTNPRTGPPISTMGRTVR